MLVGFLRMIRGQRAVVLLILSGIFTLSACEQVSVSPRPELIVETYEVGLAVAKRERKFYGRVAPADLTRVSFRIPGKINQLDVQAGQRVVQGQILAQIEDSIPRQVLEDAKAQYKLSRRQLERAERLYQRGSLTAAQRDQLRASFRLAEANWKLAESGLLYTAVKAPFDGTVADVNKELYEAVTAGETVFTVYRNERTDVLLNIPDILPAKIHQARDITALQVNAQFSGNPKIYTMRYLKASTARSPSSQAFQFWVSMPVPATPFPPGLPVTITTDLQEAGFSTDTGLVVPLTALEAGLQEDVFRVWRFEGGVVNPVSVRVGRITQDGALISSGLQAGDVIVTSGLSRLSPGLLVNNQIPSQGQ